MVVPDALWPIEIQYVIAEACGGVALLSDVQGVKGREEKTMSTTPFKDLKTSP